MRNWIVVGACATIAGALWTAAPARSQETPRLIVVQMEDFAFQPARIIVRHGDVVRFVQGKGSPHNVEFRAVPAGTELDGIEIGPVSTTGATSVDVAPPRMGPFLTQKGQYYEFVIGEYFAPGEHEIVCTPHEAMGMTGVIVVEPAENIGGEAGG